MAIILKHEIYGDKDKKKNITKLQKVQNNIYKIN